VTMTCHPRIPGWVDSLAWRDRSLYIPEREGRRRDVGARLQKDSIEITGRGWGIKLPPETIVGADEYFSRLRTALATHSSDV
jgi:hypothetical protein